MIKILITLTLSFFLIACVYNPPRANLPDSTQGSANSSILFLADPQIHNMYGVGLKQMNKGADFTSRVAIRPPELNILAPLVLKSLLEGAKQSAPAVSPLTIVLGDMTNIACSGEYDDFMSIFNQQFPPNKDSLSLFAHGNHDSFLMGTVNSYIPKNSSDNWQSIVSLYATSNAPLDIDWWGPHAAPNLDNFKNWRETCYQPQSVHNNSVPMNKLSWLAKYIDHLVAQGLDPKNYGSDGQLDYKPLDGKLKSLNYSAKGWYEPLKYSKPIWSYVQKPSPLFKETYNSFIVQSLDLSDKQKLLLIDTSVCDNATGGLLFTLRNAGAHACIGKKQFKIIKEIVDNLPNDKKLIVAGHFPLKDLSFDEQKELFSILTKAGDWTYISAHTHEALAAFNWRPKAKKNVKEYNIGSTTDWPMEMHRFFFDPQSEKLTGIETFTNASSFVLNYIANTSDTSSEVCRHMDAAKALAELRVPEVSGTWISPLHKQCDLCKEDDWIKQGAKLKDYIDKIHSRFEAEPDYKNAVLTIAASASFYESQQWQLLNLVP